MGIFLAIFMGISTVLTLLICRAAGRFRDVEEAQERAYLRSRGLDPDKVLNQEQELSELEQHDKADKNWQTASQ